MFKKAYQFVTESIDELKKVSWLSKDEAINSAVVVIGFIVVFSGLLFLLDIGVRFVIDILVKGFVR